MERDAKLLVVRDVMVKQPRTLAADLPIDAALAHLDEHGWTGAPVVDAEGGLVGVLSEVDAVRVLAGAAFHAQPPGRVADHMTKDVRSVAPDTDVYAAAQQMLDEGLRRLVVCEGGAVVGLVTIADLGRALRRIQAERDAARADRKPPGAAWDPRASEARDRKA